MREVSGSYETQVKSSGRQFGFYIRVYEGVKTEDLWLDDIISIDITRCFSDKLQLGACMSDKLTLQTRATSVFGGKGKKLVVYYRCTDPVTDWAKLGTFYVSESVTKGGVTAVTAYDMMSRLDKKISWVDTSSAIAPVFPCTMQEMLNYICARAKISTGFNCQDITIEKPPDGYTARELISYIAASHGCNARFSPEEDLLILPYNLTNAVVEYGRCYSMESSGDETFTTKGILFDTGGGTKIYIDDTAAEYDENADGVVEVYDPFATVGIAEYAWTKLGNLSFSAVSLEMPAENILEPGDVFTVKDSAGKSRTAIVMEQTLSVSCTGGFVEKITCEAESKNQTRNAENRAEATEKTAEEAISDRTAEKLVDSSGYDGNKNAFIDYKSHNMGFYNSAGTKLGEFCVREGYFMLFWGGKEVLYFNENGDISIQSMDGTKVKLTSSDSKEIIEVTSTAYTKSGLTVELNNDRTGSVKVGNGYGSQRLSFESDGLYYNGKKVLTE